MGETVDTDARKADSDTESTVAKVCVGIATFNQAAYIRQAIDSVLSQETDFPFEVLVHDDCSTDGTREIVAEYVTAHPGTVRAIFQTENQFSQGRRILPILLAEMHADYIALLDGDDFWQSDRKLQAQADFLDAHPDCAICQTKTVYLNESSNRIERIFPPPSRRRMRHENADLAKGNFIQTSAVMFRASAVPQFPPNYDKLQFGDYPMFALLSQSGWIGLVDEIMTTYRIHGGNRWVGKPKAARRAATREVCQYLSTYLRPEHQRPWAEAASAPRVGDFGGLLIRLRQLFG